MKKKILCIHHRPDLDGATSAAIVGLAMINEDVSYLKYNYKEYLDKDKLKDFDLIFAVDISFSDQLWIYSDPRLIWIDHHKSAIESDDDPRIPGIRKIGKGACELCWEYFFPNIECPLLVQYLSSYDVWDKTRFNWEKVEHIQWGAKAMFDLDPKVILKVLMTNLKLKEIISVEPNIIDILEENGKLILGYQEKVYKARVKEYGMFIPDFLGYKVLAMCTQDFTSKVFESEWDPEKYDLMLPFCFHPEGYANCSIYSTKDDVDCSKIAKGLGGGGHKGAAGFRMPMEDLLRYISTSKPIKILYMKANG